MRPIRPRLLGTVCAVFALCCAMSMSGQTAPPADDPPSQTSSSPSPSELPDSPSTAWAKSQEPAQQVRPAQVSSAPSPQAASLEKPQRPVGTAAAEAPPVSGVTAAQPAGVAIAPARQKRVRVIVLKVGAVIGAGAALGTVIALTAATPSKPPGAH